MSKFGIAIAISMSVNTSNDGVAVAQDENVLLAQDGDTLTAQDGTTLEPQPGN
jgi:hypothetical protein